MYGLHDLGYLNLLVIEMLLDGLDPGGLPLHNLIHLVSDSCRELGEVGLCLVLSLVRDPSQLVNAHLLVIDGHFELLYLLFVN